MSKLFLKEKKTFYSSYSFNRAIQPFPDAQERIKPPSSKDFTETKCFINFENNSNEEKETQKSIDDYRKAERVVVNNFYTGGSIYKTGAMDFIYKGVNIYAAGTQTIG